MRQLQKEVAGKKSQLSAENEQAEEEATKRLMEMEAVIEIKKIIDPVDTILVTLSHSAGNHKC